MPTPSDPSHPIPATDDDKQLRAWLELRDQMQELHAKLEYARLMLALQQRNV